MMKKHLFEEPLEIKFTLDIKGKTFKISGSSVCSCNLHLKSYGFRGQISFLWHSDYKKDELVEKFNTTDLIKIDLKVSPVWNLREKPLNPLNVQGIVTTKTIKEESFFDVKKNPILCRYYTIKFADPAKVLWSQHFPSNLWVEETMKTIIQQQVVEDINLQMDWDILDKKHPMIFIGLGDPKNKASFYDFLFSYLYDNNGILNYDYLSNEYKIVGKINNKQEPVSFLPDDIAQIKTKWPASLRYNLNILNALSENHKTEKLKQKDFVEGISYDVVTRFSIADDLVERKNLESQRLASREPKLEIHFAGFPLKEIVPGSLILLKSQPYWSNQALFFNEPHKVSCIDFKARIINKTKNELNVEFAGYKTWYCVTCEKEKSSWISRPKFKKPSWPIYVEGKIISGIDSEQDKTWQIVQDENTKTDQYRVKVPIWDKEIQIKFESNSIFPHFFFPLYRDTKVLIELNFYYAKIVCVLDWGRDVQIPLDSQGNHILFGKNDHDETSLKHAYEDKKPVLNIKRVNKVDTEMIRMEEGTMIFQTKEEK